jgi:hypothetical protein
LRGQLERESKIQGVREDARLGSSYLCTFSRFETADTSYAFLNRALAVGVAEIRADGARSWH